MLLSRLPQWRSAPERYVAAQGTVLGCAGRVYVSRDAQGMV
jgi:hypothetical protein